jgi:hypothetical protein
MVEKDFRRIEEMMARTMVQFQSETRQEMRQFKDEIIGKFDRAIGATEDNVQHKLDLVVEGQQSLVERMDRMEGRMVGIENRLERVEVRGAAVEKKVDGIAVDLNEHRRDTEAHRKGWRVREDEGGSE